MHALTRRDPPVGPTCAEAEAMQDDLPVGWYELADCRRFYGMNEFELRAFAREGWRLQQIADVRLAMRLDSMRPPAPARSDPAKPVLQADGQLVWAI